MMSVDPALDCPTCGRPWPERRGRICALCNHAIERHGKYRFVGSSVQHKDCQDPTLAKLAEAAASAAREQCGQEIPFESY
jgi:hypothetical protein